MKKNELLKAVAEKSNLTQAQVNDVLNGLQDVILDMLNPEVKHANSVSLPKLGTFKVKESKLRNGINPSTGEKIVIAPYKTIVFKALPSVKKVL